MTITKLRHHFPRAMPKLVDDVGDWFRRINFLLDLLKAAVHSGIAIRSDDVVQGAVLPKRWTEEVVSLKANHPSLSSLLDAVLFSTLSSRQSCQHESLRWIDRHAEELGALCEQRGDIDRGLPMLLFSVREFLSAPLFQAMVRCLTDQSIRLCHWEGMDKNLTQWKAVLKRAADQHEVSFPDGPGGETLGELVRSLLYQICAQPSKQRRGSFGLLGQILTPELVDIVAGTQHDASSKEREVRRLVLRIQSGHESIPNAKADRKTWLENATARLSVDATKHETVKAFGKCLRGMQRDREADVGPYARLLAAFPPEHSSLRVRLLARWRHERHGLRSRHQNLHRILDPLASLFHRRGIAEPLLKNWRVYLDEKDMCDEFVSDTCWEIQGKRERAIRTVRLLERAVYDQQIHLGPKLMASLVEFVQATEDDTLSCSVVVLLASKRDDYYVETDIRLAILFGESPTEIAQLLLALQKTDGLCDLLTELKPLSGDPGLRRCISKRIIENETAVLSPVAAMVSILRDLGQTLPRRKTGSRASGGCSRYPDEFRPVLESLSEATPDWEPIAKSILGKFFPSPRELAAQIDALRSKLDEELPSEIDTARMRRRLENLQRRKQYGVRVSSGRIDGLIQKLERRAVQETLERYARQCREQVMVSTCSQLGVQEFPEELLAPPMDRVLFEINRLGKPMRSLGMRMLLDSVARTTASFDEEPKNRAFRKRMESLGVNMRPWLSDEIRMSASMSDGTPYELGFTREVVDFLLMGFHFNTCLSPDSFNFFSTIANAVDLNKRVVYGKTAAGKVVGRCLFAINDTGEILSYHRYSHDPKDGFADAIDQFGQRLAGDMQTSLGSGGNVSKLVAKDWYDDGPMGGNLDWLGEGGLVSKLVERGVPERLFTDLMAAIGENVMRQRIVEVATNSQLRDRSEFLTALLDRFQDQISFRQKFVVAVNVEPITVSDRLLSQLRWSDIVRFVHRHQCDECGFFHGIGEYAQVFRVLTRHNPSLGLRAIRAARPRSIQNDLSDSSKTRRSALAQAHERLGRTRLAKRLQESRS